MLCDNCKKNIATTHIHTSVNGTVKDLHLCSYCAAEYGYLNNNGIVDMLASMFGESLLLNPAASAIKCPCCGSTFEDIANTGKAGCSECYNVFKDEFYPSLYRIHGKSRHIGKRPDKNYINIDDNKAEVQNNENEIEKLKKELKNAIETENFERAAELRDKIKEAEGENGNE